MIVRRGMSPEAAPREMPAADAELDFSALGRSLWRKKFRLLVPALVITALAFVGVNLVSPQYRSETRVLFEGRESIFLRPEAERGADRDRSADQEAMNSQVQLVLSREVARKVIDQLKLNELPEFDPVLRGSGGILRQLLSLTGLVRDPLRMSPDERVFESFYQRVRAYQVDKSRVIAIEFTSSNPTLAARGANAIAEAYLETLQTVRQEQTRAAGQWLAGEIDNLRTRVAEAESKVEEFRAKSNLFVGANNSSLSNQQLGEVTSQLAIARSQKADADAKAQLIRDMLRSGRAIEYSDIINSELIRRLNEQRVTLRAQLAEQSSTLLSGHPRIKELRAQIADLERQIRGEAERLVRALENDAQIAGARVEQLTRNLDQLKRQASSTNEQDVHLRALEREAKAQRDLLESYLAKYREATARENLTASPADARVISRAIVSNTPYFPRKVPIIVLAFLGTLLLGVALAATGELMSGNAYRMPARSGAFLDGADQHAAESEGDVAPATTDEMARALRSFVARATQPREHSIAATVNALRALRGGRSRSAVIGLTPDAHVGTTALALTHALADAATVVLVRLVVDSEAPVPGPGAAEFVRGEATLEEIVRRDSASRAHVIEAGHIEGDPLAVVNADRIVVVIDALEHAYDHVVLDLGPMPDIANERLARLASTVVLVATESVLAGADAVREPLLEAGCRNVLVVKDEPAAEQARAA